jgi:ABC-type nitrate/sulfonate/bicarbonate transport system substrate-binding protein
MEEMRGKKVGITSPGGSFDQSLRAALPKYNLQPDKDVTFIATGSIANVTAALISGAIDGAAILVGPDLQKVEATGLKSLFDFADLNLPNAAAAISFTRSYLNAQRNTVQAYVDSYIEGRVKFTHDKSAAIRALGEIYKTNDQAGLDLTYDYYNREKVLPTLPYPQVEALKNTADTLCKTNAKLCAFDVSKVVDPSFVKNAADRGLDKG